MGFAKSRREMRHSIVTDGDLRPPAKVMRLRVLGCFSIHTLEMALTLRNVRYRSACEIPWRARVSGARLCNDRALPRPAPCCS